MRHYIDLIAQYIAESLINELEHVAIDNASREIGSGGKSVSATMNDMLPHHGVSERNKPQAYAEIFAKATGDTHNDSFEREVAPSPERLKQRRNNDAGIQKLHPVPKGGDANAVLHTDFAGRQPLTRSIISRKTTRKTP